MVTLKLIVLVALLADYAHAQPPTSHYSLVDNLNQSLSHQNLADKILFGVPTKKHIPIVAGAEFLLKYLGSSPQYRKDPIWSRLAHTHPISTVAYREENSPSTHVVFLRLPDGSLKADIHLDGNGPQSMFAHLDEFLFHKLTFQDNNQDRMNANLKRSRVRDTTNPDEVFISKRERTLLFVHETLGIKPIASSFGNAMFWRYTHEFIWKADSRYEPMLNKVEGSLFRNVLKNSIELGIANWRQEDTRYRPSGLQGASARVRQGLLRAYVVPTPTGTEFAYARFAGIIGAAAVTDTWHPWREPPYKPNYYRQAALGIVLGPLAKSMWTEFGPDIRRRLHIRK